MKNNFSPSSNTASLFSWFVRHWKQLLAAIVILSAIAFACHKLYLFLSLPESAPCNCCRSGALDLDGYDKVMFVAHPDDDLLWGGRHLIEDDYLVVCMTRGNDPVRSAEFKSVMEATGDKHLILSYPDKSEKIAAAGTTGKKIWKQILPQS